MNLTVITGSGLILPNGNASTNRLTEIAKGFESNGYNCIILPLRRPKQQNNTKDIYRGVNYNYVLNHVSNTKRVIYRIFLFDFFLLLFRLNWFFRKEKVKIVFCGTSSISTIFILKLAAILNRITLIYDIVEDPYASFLAKEIKEFSVFQKFIHYKNFILIPFYYYFAWRLPDFITVITETQLKKVISLGINNRKSFILPILKHTVPKEKTENNDVNYRRLIHSGSTYFPKDGIQEILEAIRLLNKKGFNLFIEFYGPIGEKEKSKILLFAKNNNLLDLIFIKGLVPLEELYLKQKTSLALICYKPNIMQNRYNFATKLIDYMDSGRPIVITDLPSYKGYFINGKNAYISEGFTYIELAREIENIYNNKEESDKVGIEARRLLDTEFNSQILINNLLKWIQI